MSEAEAQQETTRIAILPAWTVGGRALQHAVSLHLRSTWPIAYTPWPSQLVPWLRTDPGRREPRVKKHLRTYRGKCEHPGCSPVSSDSVHWTSTATVESFTRSIHHVNHDLLLPNEPDYHGTAVESSHRIKQLPSVPSLPHLLTSCSNCLGFLGVRQLLRCSCAALRSRDYPSSDFSDRGDFCGVTPVLSPNLTPKGWVEEPRRARCRQSQISGENLRKSRLLN
jgi:hypothetical protein